MPYCPPEQVDCDEIAMYAASLLLSQGVSCQFVTVSTDPKDPMRFNHVYVQAVLEDGRRIPMDFDQPKMGMEGKWIRRKEWPIIHPSQDDQGNLSPAKS